MIPLLFGLLLLFELCYGQPSWTQIVEDFEACQPSILPFFDSVLPDLNAVCDNAESRTLPYSLQLFTSTNPTTARLSKGISLPVNTPVKIQFWLKVGDGTNPYQFDANNDIQGSWTLPSSPTAQTFEIRRDPRVLPSNGWFKYSGTFTAIVLDVDFAMMQLEVDFRRSAPDPFASVWMDNLVIGIVDALVIGDPQFVGLRGQTYQVHGIDGTVYNLVSSESTQVNTRFIFLEQGDCPVFDGIAASNCWAHPGSYLSEIGVQQVVDGLVHRLKIVSGPAALGFTSIELDDQLLQINDTYEYDTIFGVTFESTHVVKVQTEDFVFTFENSDNFINQAVAPTKPLSLINAHGLFGQTHTFATFDSTLRYIAGEIDDYVIDENELFGNCFIYNRFQPRS